jgi:membrane-associated phospholipid phosphatase
VQCLEFPFPEGVEVYLYHSFPSGYTATAFALLFGVSLLIKNKIAKLLLLSLAILTGYSRVYLSLHFPSDVLAGSVIGVLTSALLYNWIFRWKKAWLDKSMQDFLFPGGSR